MDTIVYTYKKPLYQIYTKDTNQLEWIKKSVASAKAIDYSTFLLTDDTEFGKQSGVDEVIFYRDNSYVWDSFKIKALECLTEPFFLSDNDVIFHKPLEFGDHDMYYDTLETQWERHYMPTVNKVSYLKLLDNKHYWDPSPRKVINAGILKFNNQTLKEKYIVEWNELERKFHPFISEFNLTTLTGFLSQYILTLLIADCNTQYLSNKTWPSQCEYYTHYAGMGKVEKTLI